jgi:large subunit ribosomal protein L25
VYTVDLSVDGTNFKAIMQDIQFHAVNNKILHIDFLELFEEKKVVTSIPVWLKGTPSGVRAGGQMLAKMRKLKISALPKHLPDSVELNVEKLEIGDAIRVRDMKIDGVEFLDIPANSIVAVKTTRVVVEEVPVATATTAVAGAPAVPGAPGAAPAAGAPGAAPAAGSPGAAPAAGAPAKKEEKKK